MDLLIGFVVGAVIVTMMLIQLIFWVSNKSAGVAITSYFQAAEYILEHHQPPLAWTNPPIPLSQRLFRQGKAKSPPDPAYLLQRMDDLIAFFEHSTFFQDEETRAVLLEQLNDERESWKQHN